jgi:WD40 repeat protein
MISNNTDQNLKLTSPFWSPDSSRIAYVSEPMSSSAGEKTRSVCMTEQGKTGTVFKSNAPLRLIGWSASGKEIFVALGESEIHTPPQEVSLLRISANQEKPETIARVPAAYLHNIKLSRDGQSIALVSRQDGRDNVNVVPTSGGLVKKITSNSDPTVYYSGLTWSPDGKTLLYSKQTSWALVVMIENFK